MARGWRTTIQLHLLHNFLPSVIVDRVFIEIIHSVESVITTKDVNRSIMDNYTNGELSIKDKYQQRVCHVGKEYLWVVRKNFKWMNLLFSQQQGFNSNLFLGMPAINSMFWSICCICKSHSFG
jgi:hypothetical protein